MLANNFMTAQQLGINQKDWDAAVKLLGMLERGEIVYHHGQNYRSVPVGVKGFNIACWLEKPWLEEPIDCGTVGCLGGWITLLTGEALSLSGEVNEEINGEWYKLFCPRGYDTNPSRFTVEAAAVALRSMLTTGKPDWSLVAR